MDNPRFVPLTEELQGKLLDALIVASEILDANNIPYWLDGGTLLCAIRDHDLCHEHDIDIGIFAEDWMRIHKLAPSFVARNFSLDPFSWGGTENPHPFYHVMHHIPGEHPVHRLDMMCWHDLPDTDMKTCWGVNLPFSLPKRFFNEREMRSSFAWGGRDFSFMVPKEFEEYLSWYYGDDEWKIPMTSGEYDRYQAEAKSGLRKPYRINEPRPEVFSFWKRMQEMKIHPFVSRGV